MPTFDLRRLAYSLGPVVFLAACAPTPIDTNSPDYSVGYTDGCASAMSKEERNKDMWESSAEYRQGWRSGWDTCGDGGEMNDDNTMFPNVFSDLAF